MATNINFPTYGFVDDIFAFSEENWRKFFKPFVYDSVQNGLEVTAGTGMTVNVSAGECRCGAVMGIIDEVATLDIGKGHSSYARIDSIAVQYQYGEPSTLSLVVVPGTPAANPVAPTLSKNFASLWQMEVAQVEVPANATASSQCTFTDKRTIVDIGTISAEIAALQSDVAGLESDVLSITTDIAGLKSDVASITSDIATIDSEILSITTNIETIEGEILSATTDIASLSTSKQDVLTFDDAPTAGSDNPVKSDGIKTAVDNLNDSLQALITDNIEDEMVASKAYAVGEFVVVGNGLYKVSATVAQGDDLVVGTNVVKTTIVEQLMKSRFLTRY